MADSNNRVGIKFDVDADELKQITEVIGILDRFNKRASQVTGALGTLTNAYSSNTRASRKQADEFVNLDKVMSAWSNRIKQHQSVISSYEASQAKMTDKLKEYNRDVKMTVDENGRLTASFKNAEGNIVSLKGKYDLATNSVKDLKTSLSTVSLEVQKKAEADKKAAKEMDRLHAEALKVNKEMDAQKRKYQELTRGTDISRVLKMNAGSFDVLNDAIKINGNVVRGSIDRNGKFSQTLRMQDGTLRTITGYYDKANKKLIQYSEAVSRSESATRRATDATNRFKGEVGILERSMKGLNKYTMTWGDAITIAGTRMLQWSVASTAIFGLQQAMRSVVETLFEIDSQMTQLKRVMSDSTDFTQVWKDSINLSTTYGKTITEINDALITFAKSGYNEIDTRSLAEATTLMSNVSDIDMSDAAESITSAITLFNVKARDAIQVVNKLNEVNISASRCGNAA